MARITMKLIHGKLQELSTVGLSMIIVEQGFGFATLFTDDLVLLRMVQMDSTSSSDDKGADEAAQQIWPGI